MQICDKRGRKINYSPLNSTVSCTVKFSRTVEKTKSISFLLFFLRSVCFGHSLIILTSKTKFVYTFLVHWINPPLVQVYEEDKICKAGTKEDTKTNDTRHSMNCDILAKCLIFSSEKSLNKNTVS